MNVAEMYRHITEDTDPDDPVVAEEIKKAIRQSDGITDIQFWLPRLRKEAKGNVMEIGVHWGISTVALLLGVEEQGGHLWSVDVNDCRILEHPQWTFIQAHTVEEADKIKSIVPQDLDLLFIDGDHNYPTVFSDLVLYGPRAKKILLHDSEQYGVRSAIECYLGPFSRHRFLSYHVESHGLSVLW